MKKLFYFLLIGSAALQVSCSGNKPQEEVNTTMVNIPDGDALPGTMPVMTFGETKHDFGTITEGEKVSYTFKFKNTGGSDLVITSARGSCGCTVPEYPHEPIKPNKEGLLHVTFDSSGKDGMQHKDVTIVTNGQPNTKVIQITANVVKAEDKQDNDK